MSSAFFTFSDCVFLRSGLCFKPVLIIPVFDTLWQIKKNKSEKSVSAELPDMCHLMANPSFIFQKCGGSDMIKVNRFSNYNCHPWWMQPYSGKPCYPRIFFDVKPDIIIVSQQGFLHCGLSFLACEKFWKLFLLHL